MLAEIIGSHHDVRQVHQPERREQQGEGVRHSEGRDHPHQLPQRGGPQHQGADEQEVVGAGQDVVDALPEEAADHREPVRPRPRGGRAARAGPRARLEVEPVGGLVDAAALAGDADRGVGGLQGVHEEHGDAGQVVVAERELVRAAPGRQGGVPAEVDVAGAVQQPPRGREAGRLRAQRLRPPVHRERQVPPDPLGVGALPVRRDDAAVRADRGQHLRRDADARRQPQLHGDAARLQRDRRGLEVLVQPVRGGGRPWAEQKRPPQRRGQEREPSHGRVKRTPYSSVGSR